MSTRARPLFSLMGHNLTIRFNGHRHRQRTVKTSLSTILDISTINSTFFANRVVRTNKLFEFSSQIRIRRGDLNGNNKTSGVNFLICLQTNFNTTTTNRTTARFVTGLTRTIVLELYHARIMTSVSKRPTFSLSRVHGRLQSVSSRVTSRQRL